VQRATEIPKAITIHRSRAHRHRELTDVQSSQLAGREMRGRVEVEPMPARTAHRDSGEFNARGVDRQTVHADLGHQNILEPRRPAENGDPAPLRRSDLDVAQMGIAAGDRDAIA
jgi:hypothetical protein